MLEHLSEIFPEGSPYRNISHLNSTWCSRRCRFGLPAEMINAANAASQEAFQNALDNGQSAEDAFISAIEQNKRRSKIPSRSSLASVNSKMKM